jgi:hypothetical protein
MISLGYMKKLLLTLVILFSYPQLSHTLERFIPLELFSDGEIREDTEIKFTKADKIFGEKKKKLLDLRIGKILKLEKQ